MPVRLDVLVELIRGSLNYTSLIRQLLNLFASY